MELLSSYKLDALLDFFVFLIEQEFEEKLWGIWLHKETGMEFEEFKKESLKQGKNKEERKRMSKEEEEKAISKAEKILQIKDYTKR